MSAFSKKNVSKGMSFTLFNIRIVFFFFRFRPLIIIEYPISETLYSIYIYNDEKYMTMN